MEVTIDRNKNIDFLKGVCIILVCLTHVNFTTSEKLQMLFPFWVIPAVPIFMAISGYVSTKSLLRRKLSELEDMYTINQIVPRLLKYIIPFAIAYGIELLWQVYVGNSKLGISKIVRGFFCGGIEGLKYTWGGGYGHYYFPCLLQLTIFMPAIYYVVDKKRQKGLLFCLLINIVYEFLNNMYGLNYCCYTLLFFRYLFCVAWGAFLAHENSCIKKRTLMIMFLIGISFLVLHRYIGYSPKILLCYNTTGQWTQTTYLGAFYVMSIVYFLFKLKLHFTCLELLGKCSYGIFLVQMLFYRHGAQYVYTYISNRFLQILACLGICIVLGILFHFLTCPVVEYLVERIKKYCALLNWNVRG